LDILRKSVEEIIVSFNLTRTTSTLHKDLYTFVNEAFSILV